MTHANPQTPALKGRSVKLIAKLLVAILLTVFFVCTGLFLLIRFGLDGTRTAWLLVPRLEEALGRQISFSSADLHWMSTATGRISIHNVKILDKPGIALTIHIPEVVCEISLGHLLKGMLLVNKAEFLRPSFFIHDRSRVRQDSEPTVLPPAVQTLIYAKIRRLELTGGVVILSESPEHPHRGKVLFSQINLWAEDVTRTGVDRASLKGVVSHAGKEGTLDISGRFSGDLWTGRSRNFVGQTKASSLPLPVFQTLASLLGLHWPFSDGSVDFNAEFSGTGTDWTASGFLGLTHVRVKRGNIFIGDVPLDKAGANFLVQGSSNTVNLDLTEVSAPGINLSLVVKATDTTTSDPVLSLAVRKADLDLEKIFPLIPSRLISPQDRVRLMDAGLKGHAVITKGGWTGRFSEISRGLSPHGTLELVAILDKISGFFPGIGLPVSNATGEIRLNSDEIVFKGISLTVGNSPIVLNGWIVNLKSSPRVDLFVSTKAEAQDLQPILENRIVAAHLGTLSGWFNDPGGTVSVTLDLKGNLLRPDMKGRIAFEDFQCSPNRLPLPLKKINGSVRFRSSGATSSDIKGLLGVSPFVVKGSVLQDNIDVGGEIKLNPADFKKLDMIPSNFTALGLVPVSVNLKGKISELTFSSIVDLKGNAVNLGLIIDKKAGIPLRLELSGIRDASGINLDDAALILDKSRISGKASIREDKKVSVIVNLPPKGIPTAVLTPYFHSNLELQPGGRLEGDAAISFGNSLPISIEANVLFSHLSLRLPGMHKRSEGLTGSLRHRAKSMQLNLERARVGSSLISGTMTVTDFEAPKLEILLESSFLDTTDFTAPPGQMIRMSWGDYIRTNPVIRFLARSKGTGFVRVAKGQTGLRTFSDFRANLEGNNGLIRVPSWQANFADGILRGSALFDISNNTSKPLVLDFQGDRLKMERMIVSDPAWLRVSGDMIAEGHLGWSLGPSWDGRGLYKTGHIEVRMNDGVINRFDILSKLFSLVNLGSFLRGRLPDLIGQGLPFHRLTWKMEVFDNKWKVKDLKLLSDAARVDSSGMYFGGQERVDFRMDVSPLVGIDAIFSGLFGSLITRDGKTLTTTFRIRGLYSSPDVRLEPFENLKIEE